MHDQRGFSLVELIVVVLVVSILAAIAQPKFHQVRVKARAAAALGDMQVVRVALYEYQSEEHDWPANSGPGVIPPGLAAYLPGGFDFNKKNYVLDFDNWGGSPFKVGVTVVTTDGELGLTLLDMLPRPKWTSTDKYTWVIE